MSGNGSRNRSRDYGARGTLLPTPRACSGLRSSGINQTEILMTMERLGSTFSQAGFLASPSASPGSAAARETTAGSGLRWCALLTRPSRAGLLVRTLLGSSRWGSMIVSLTWHASATKRGRLLFRLRASEPSTAGIGSGLWPTPTAGEFRTNDPERLLERREECKRRHGGNGFGLTLGNAMTLVEAGLLPTPNAARAANDTTLRASGDGRAKPNKLGWAVAERLLPTPLASDADGGRTTKGQDRGAETGLRLAVKERLLPTPRSEGFDAWGHRGRDDSLDSAVRSRMLPTPTSADGERTSASYARGNPTLVGALLPTPTAKGNDNRAGASPKAGNGLATAMRLLPTPEARLAKSGADPDRGDRPGAGGEDLTTTLHRLLPTPTGQDGHNNGAPSQLERRTPPLNAEMGGL
jgi:hypothetical protein